jgi:hypothetical protein
MTSQSPGPEISPPHVRVFRSVCPSCSEVFEGRFPMWTQIQTFTCLCGAKVPSPKMLGRPGPINTKPLPGPVAE